MSTPRSPRSARRRTRTRPSAGSRAASSSGCAWRRRSSPIPVLILADEPLLSLDLAHQRGVVDLLDARRQQRRDAGRLRHPRHQPGAAHRRPGPLPRARLLGDRDAGRGADLRDALAPLRHRRRRPPRARPRRRRRDAGRPARPPRGERTTDVHAAARPALRPHRALGRRGGRGRLGRDRRLRRDARDELRGARDLGARLHRRRGRARDRDRPGARDTRRLAVRRARARAPLPARAGTGQRDRSGARVRARPRRPLLLALPGLRDRGDEPPLRQHRRRLRHAAAQPRDRRGRRRCSVSRCSTGRCSSRASTPRSRPRAECPCARSRSRSSSCSR